MNIRALSAFIRTHYAKLPEKQQPIAFIIGSLLILLVITLLLKSCFHLIVSISQSPPQPIMIRHGKKIIIPEHSPLRSELIIKTVKSATLAHIVSIPGIVEANPVDVVKILPPVTGHLVTLNVGLGDVVKHHQRLASMQSAGLAQALADKDKAQSTLTLSRLAFKRAKSVNLAGGNTLKDVEMAENNEVQAQAEVTRTIATLKSMGKHGINLLHIRSPIEGRVTAINYGRGSYITDPTAPLMTISNLKSLWVTANIPENLTGVISKNLPVEIHLLAYPHQTLKGKVSFVSDFLEPDTRRNKTRIKVTNPFGKLQPNMYATVKIATTQTRQIIIPISSVIMNNDTTSVFVETSPWTFEQHEITLGAEDGGNVRVLKGLRPGDNIVTAGGVLVND